MIHESRMYVEVFCRFMEGKTGPQNCHPRISLYPKFHVVWTAWLRVNITLRILRVFIDLTGICSIFAKYDKILIQ